VMQPALPNSVHDRIWTAQTVWKDIVKEVLFDPFVKYSGVIRKGNVSVCVMKGAVNAVLAKCTKVWFPLDDSSDANAVIESMNDTSRYVDFDENTKLAIEQRMNEQIQRSGERALAFAFSVSDKFNNEEWAFGGVLFMKDSVMGEISGQIEELRNSYQVRVVLASGDEKETVKAAALAAGIENPNVVFSGNEFERSAAEIAQNCSLYYKMNPQQKAALVKSLQKQGHRVAVIGDPLRDKTCLAAANLAITLVKGISNVNGLPMHLRWDVQGWSRRFVTVLQTVKASQHLTELTTTLAHLSIVYSAVAVAVICYSFYHKIMLLSLPQLLLLECIKRWWHVSVWQREPINITTAATKSTKTQLRHYLLCIELLAALLAMSLQWYAVALIAVMGPVLCGYAQTSLDRVAWYNMARLRWWAAIGLGYALLHIDWVCRALELSTSPGGQWEKVLWICAVAIITLSV